MREEKCLRRWERRDESLNILRGAGRHLCHGLHHVGVSGLHGLEGLAEVQEGVVATVTFLVSHEVLETLGIPVLGGANEGLMEVARM